MAYEFYIGGRYFRTKQRQTFISLITLLSVIGVAVGVMALIVVISVMSGFRSDLESRILGIEAHIVLRHQGVFSDHQSAICKITSADDVAAASPFIDGQVMLRSSLRATGAMIMGINPDSASDIYQKFDAGMLSRQPAGAVAADGASAPKIILGKELAGSLGVVKGDAIYAISPRGTLSPFGHIPGMKRFQIEAIFTTGVYEYDGSLAFIHIEDAQSLFRMGTAISGVTIQADDLYQVKTVSKRLLTQLGTEYYTKDWMQRNESLFSALKLEKIAMFVILVLIVLVAAFNIAGSLIMMVMEKARDIAILMAMGSTRKSIRKIFVFKGLITGLVGVVLGTGFGVALCLLLRHYRFVQLPDDLYYITTLPVKLGLFDVTAIAVSAIVICFLSTLYPAHKAAKLNPMEALRYG